MHDTDVRSTPFTLHSFTYTASQVKLGLSKGLVPAALRVAAVEVGAARQSIRMY